MTFDPRALLRRMFDAAIEAAQPSHCIPPHLPDAPKGRLIVLGAGKASAAMARAVEDHWPGEMSGLVVTRYGYAVPCERIEIVEGRSSVVSQGSVPDRELTVTVTLFSPFVNPFRAESDWPASTMPVDFLPFL